MKYLVLALVFAAGFATAHLTGLTTAADPKPAPPQPAANVPPPNPNIDMDGFIKGAQAAAKVRESRRLSEDDFLKMSQEGGVIVLDARSKEMYDLLHVKGAINLSFPNIDVVSLSKVLPDKKAKILIYCNNNFTPSDRKVDQQQVQTPGQPATKREVADLAMRPKRAITSLNLSTYIALYNYGYRNVYELGPLIDIKSSRLEFESSGRR